MLGSVVRLRVTLPAVRPVFRLHLADSFLQQA